MRSRKRRLWQSGEWVVGFVDVLPSVNELTVEMGPRAECPTDRSPCSPNEQSNPATPVEVAKAVRSGDSRAVEGYNFVDTAPITYVLARYVYGDYV